MMIINNVEMNFYIDPKYTMAGYTVIAVIPYRKNRFSLGRRHGHIR